MIHFASAMLASLTTVAHRLGERLVWSDGEIFAVWKRTDCYAASVYYVTVELFNFNPAPVCLRDRRISHVLDTRLSSFFSRFHMRTLEHTDHHGIRECVERAHGRIGNPGWIGSRKSLRFTGKIDELRTS